MQLLILVLMLGLTWVLFVRPQQQRLKRQKELVASLTPGDRVVTAGGMIGTITAVRTGDIDVELAPGLSVRMLSGAVTRRWTEPDGGAGSELAAGGVGAALDADPDRGAGTGPTGHALDADPDPGSGTGPIDRDRDERGPAA